jgi:hypothetical protein
MAGGKQCSAWTIFPPAFPLVSSFFASGFSSYVYQISDFDKPPNFGLRAFFVATIIIINTSMAGLQLSGVS